MNLAKYIDHTILKPDATKEDIRILCEEAKTYGFASVCVNPYWVSYAKQLLQETDVAICTVVGFPLGATPACVKAYETSQAIDDGADEIDMVINIGALKSQDTQTVLEDIKAVVKASKQKLVKVIIETCLLTDEQKRLACQLALEAQADFVKTSTGFSSHGATLEDVALMKSVVKDQAKVKASGGIRDYATAMSMIEAGASRLGTSSGVKITKNL